MKCDSGKFETGIFRNFNQGNGLKTTADSNKLERARGGAHRLGALRLRGAAGGPVRGRVRHAQRRNEAEERVQWQTPTRPSATSR